MAVFLAPRDDTCDPRLGAVSGGCARWIGASGKRYSAGIYKLGAALPAAPGILILAKPRGASGPNWTALFVGSDAQVASAIGDIRRHSHLWNFAVELGLSAIHLVTAAAGAAERHDIARDLIRSLLPSLNRETAAMHRLGGVGTSLGVTT